MTTIFSYETFDPETGRLVVAPTKRTREAIRSIGGCLIKETAEVLADEWVGRRASSLPSGITDAVSRNRWNGPYALFPGRAKPHPF